MEKPGLIEPVLPLGWHAERVRDYMAGGMNVTRENTHPKPYVAMFRKLLHQRLEEDSCAL